jgi:hypothetical protein
VKEMSKTLNGTLDVDLVNLGNGALNAKIQEYDDFKISYTNKINNNQTVDKRAYQDDVSSLEENINTIIQKSIPLLQIGSSGLSDTVQSLSLGNSLLSVQIGPSASQAAMKTAIKNGEAIADISDCVRKITNQLNLPPTVKLIQIGVTKDSKLNLDNINSVDYHTQSLTLSLYRSDTLQEVNTAICNNSTIYAAIPVGKAPKSVNMKLYNRLKTGGIDSMDANDPAFNDKCYQYTDIGGGDTTVNSRRKYYFQGVSVQCLSGSNNCTFLGVLQDYINCGCQSDPRVQLSSNLVPKELDPISPINIDIVKCIPHTYDVINLLINREVILLEM